MQTVTFKSRAVAAAVSTAAIAVIVVLAIATAAWGSARDMAYALVVALLCGITSWAAAQRAMTGIGKSISSATARLVSAAHGDLQTPVLPVVRRELPDLAIAMDSLFSQVRANLDNVHLLAMFDPVTGLPNRMSFCRQVDRLLAERQSPGPAALFFLDLDGFKVVNDTLGHAAGDQLLARIAGRLREVVMTQVQAGAGDAVIGRLAGDEFTLFFPDIPHRAAAERIARAIQFALGERFDLGGQQIALGASIGIAYHPDHGATLADLLRAADIAMYHAKSNGRGRAEMFTAELARKAAGKEALERDLRAGLERGEFLLQFQPQIDVGRNRAIVAEALLRWVHPERDMLFPATFVQVAEESGMIVELGDWIMDQVCETAARWARQGLDQRVAINISARELSQADFFLRLRRAMTRHGTPPEAIELEITESLAMDMDARLRDQLQALRESGIRIAIDDFGTGYSNLARLRDLPVDRVKIDSSLVRNIETSAEARTICSAVVALIQGLGLDVVIEGVETEGQVAILRVIGCTVFQGYHLAHPTHEPDYVARFGQTPYSVLEA